MPFQVVAVLLFLASVGMLFIYVRRRVGEWLALAAILPILFLGPSWDDLLFPFQMALFGCIACGIAALLMLERHDRIGDLAAMALLLTALFFFDLGIPFVAAATVELAFGRDRWRRAYVVAVPTAIWLIWYAGWGHNADTFISLHQLREVAQLHAGRPAARASRPGSGSAPTRMTPARSTGDGRSWSWPSAWWPGASTSSVGSLPACSARPSCCSASGS